MGIEREDDLDQKAAADEQAAEAAAFESSFEGTTADVNPSEEGKPEATAAEPVAEAAPAAQQTEEKPEATQPAAESKPEEAAPTAPSPKADDIDLRAEVRKLHGRIGALNDQLIQALRAKETEGKPAVLSTVRLERLKAEYPEIADILEADLVATMSSLSQKEADPKAIEEMVTSRVAERVAAEAFAMRKEAVTDRHPNWATDCWTDEPGGTRTPEYQAWINTMTEDEASAFENSQNPSFVNRKLEQFYDWKSKAAQAEAEKQNRLQAAITPQGTARAGPKTMSEEEAERRAFEDSFNS